jgi:hypothetical protein
MANFGVGLAQGFSIGTQIGEGLRKRRMRDRFEEAQKEKAFAKYTPEQGEQMRREAAMVDEFGRPVYEFSIAPGSTTYTRRELAYPGGYSTGLGPTPESEAAAAPAMESRDQMGTTYRVPSVSDMYSSQPYERDLTGETYYRPSEARVSAAPESVPAVSSQGLTAEERLYTPDLTATTPTPREVAARLGLTPREYGESMTYAPGAAEYLGKTYANMPTEGQQRAGLMNRYADIMSEYDPIEGEKFRSMARQEARAEQEFDLNTQVKKFQIASYQREDDAANKMQTASDAMAAAVKKNPNITPAELTNVARSAANLNPKQLNEVVSSIAGLDKAELDFMTTQVERSLRKVGGSLDGLMKEFNDNPLFDPTTNVTRVVGKDGRVSLNFVSADDPNKVLNTFSFKNDLEARDFLIQSARNPGTQAEWMSKMRYQDALANQAESRAAYFAGGGGQRAGRDYSVQDNARISTALTGQRNSILRQIADQDEIINGMGNKEEKDRAKKVRQSLAGQLDTIDVAIADVNSQLTGRGGLSRGGGGGTEPKPKVGQTYIVPNPETGEDMQVRLKKGDGSKEEDWEILEYKRSRGGKSISGPITRPGEKLPTVDEDKKKK